MKIETLILSHDYSPCFISRDEIDDDFLLKGVKSRQQNSIDKGENWTKDGISIFGLEVVKAINSGEHPDLSKAIGQLVIFIMVYEINFLKVSPKTYNNYKMKLTINQSGIVKKTSENLVKK
jgi:hypothetical protein